MKKLFLNIVAVAITICSMAGLAALSPAAYAANPLCPNGQPSTTSDLTGCDGFGDSPVAGTDLNSTLNTIINVVIGIVGFVAVVMMILGGISFITSQGDTAKVTKARNTILYGVVGLIVALLAFAIVNFVLSSVFSSGAA